MTPTPPPTLHDVLAARHLLSGHLTPTPTRTYPALDRATGTRLHLKHDNLTPVRAFKIRGALTLLLRLQASDRARGIVAYSTGNHAQALAYAARVTATPATVVMPEGANPVKARAVADLGARLVLAGADLTGAAAHAADLAERTGARLVTAAGEPDLVAGVATAYLELLEAVPDVGTVLVPVGGGSGAAAACLVTAALAPHVRVIAVQSAAARAAHDSYHGGRLVTRPIATRAEGLATGTGFSLTQEMMAGLHDFVLVDDDALDRAAALATVATGTLVEPSAAAGVAALLADPARYAGTRVATLLTGGNVAPADLARIAAHAPALG